MTMASCPSEEQLTPLAVGEAAEAGVESHVRECSECRQRLNRLQKEIGTVRLRVAEATSTGYWLDSGAAAESDDPTLAGMPAFAPGSSLGRYVLVEKIGQGGMGMVYKARDERMGRFVAIKILTGRYRGCAELLQRFQREVRAAAQLSHANIVAAYDADEADGVPYFVMEYVDGTDLAALVNVNGPMSVTQAIDCITQAARALQYAHDKGVVHRDIKPGNLLLDSRNCLKVLDMGLARTRPAEGALEAVPSDLTRGDQILGSIHYMAPEQATNPRDVDPRADIYSLGCTLYFLLTGRFTYQSDSVLSVIVAHREQPIPSLRQKRKDVPPALEALFRRMVAKQRADRPASMTEVLAALQECRRPTARWRHAVVAAIVLAVLAVAAPVGWHLGIRKPAGPPVVAAADPIEANAEALSLYRKALRAIELRQERQMEIAIDSLQSAIRLVPNSPRAYAALADAYNLAGDYGWRMPDDSFLLAKQAAQKALQYDEQMADAHLALAFALTEYDCEWKQAEKAHLRALELAPQSAAAHHWYAWFLVYQRRFDEADKHMKKAQDLARDDIIIACNSGKISYYARAYRVAVGKFQQALEMNEDFRKAHWDLGLTYTQMGRLTDAVREFELAKGLAADGRDLQAALACAYASNNEPAKARELVAKLEPLPATRSLAYEVACVYAALGEKNKAFACLDRSFREKSAWRCYIKVDPRLDPIRTDERFDAYLRQAGFLAE